MQKKLGKKREYTLGITLVMILASLGNKTDLETSRKKMLFLKLAVVSLYALCVALLVLGQVFCSDVLTISGLMCFTAAAALTTYYMVLTQP